MKWDAIVIGAGIGGLSAAIALASHQKKVLLLEARSLPGGKAGHAVLQGVRADTGPSVLTLVHVFDDLFQMAGTTRQEMVSLLRPDPFFRYIYPDGVTLDIYHQMPDTLESIRSTLGSEAESEFSQFMQYAARIWQAASKTFVYSPMPTMSTIFSLGCGVFRLLAAIDPLHNMKQAIDQRIRSPHLRSLMLRYATYNGSDMRRAPATLNCIAHVELSLGGYGVAGGIYALVEALIETAKRLNITIECETRVREIWIDKSRVKGVVIDGGRRIEAPVVVANADAAQVADKLLPQGMHHGIPARDSASMSGSTAIVRAARRSGPEQRVAHTVVFPDDYEREHSDIFEKKQAPEDPTIYLCAQEVCHQVKGWPDHEPVFMMCNAPAILPNSDESSGSVAVIDKAVEKLRIIGLIEKEDEVVWKRTPKGLADAFPYTKGSIYGAASNTRTAAFKRPPNKVGKIPGLYLASGSAHPGGGLPLCALSGMIAARCALVDLKK